MAYVEGRPLSAFVRPDRPLAPTAASAVVRKLALALDEAHKKGVVHRDLKPANVMINQRKEPVVMDFGLAWRETEGGARLTGAGSLLGTPAYMAPEQATGDPAAVGPLCDVYGLGAILYELLTGRPPFEGPVAAVLGQVMTRAPEPPSRHRPDVDRRLEAVCLKAMARRPQDRYASMAEFARALTDYLQAVREGAATTPSAGSIFPTLIEEGAPPAAPRRRWPWIAAGAATGLALLVPVAFLLSRPRTCTLLVDAGSALRVTVDGEWVVEGRQDAFDLAAGEHTFAVEHDGEPVRPGQVVFLENGERRLVVQLGKEEVTGDRFTLARGQDTVLRVGLEDVAASLPKEAPPDGGTAGAGKPPAPDRFTLRVLVRTGPGKGSAGKAMLAVMLNGNLKHYRLARPEYRPGATSEFDLDFDLPPDDVHNISLVYRGNDAWLCQSVEFQFLRDGRLLARHPFAVNGWFSGEGKDVKKLKARRIREFAIPRGSEK